MARFSYLKNLFGYSDEEIGNEPTTRGERKRAGLPVDPNPHDHTLDENKDVAFGEEEIGQYGRGNIDLYNRPKYKNEDGSISTVRSMSTNIDGKEVLLPTIAYDSNGNPVSLTNEQAVQRYRDTGEHLGKFDTINEANKYAEALHRQQEKYYKNKNTSDDGTSTSVLAASDEGYKSPYQEALENNDVMPIKTQSAQTSSPEGTNPDSVKDGSLTKEKVVVAPNNESKTDNVPTTSANTTRESGVFKEPEPVKVETVRVEGEKADDDAYSRYMDLFKKYYEESPEEREAQQKKMKREAIISAIADGSAALGNLAATFAGEKSSFDPRNSMSEKTYQRWEKQRKENLAERAARFNAALGAMKARDAITYQEAMTKYRDAQMRNWEDDNNLAMLKLDWDKEKEKGRLDLQKEKLWIDEMYKKGMLSLKGRDAAIKELNAMGEVVEKEETDEHGRKKTEITTTKPVGQYGGNNGNSTGAKKPLPTAKKQLP